MRILFYEWKLRMTRIETKIENFLDRTNKTLTLLHTVYIHSTKLTKKIV